MGRCCYCGDLHAAGLWRPFDHIELRAEESLPVTQTCYSSHFIHPHHLALFSDVPTFVTEWLDEWANDPKWREAKFQSKQMELDL